MTSLCLLYIHGRKAFPIAQLDATERRKEKPREGRAYPKVTQQVNGRPRSSTLDSHWGVCHWVGKTGVSAVYLCLQPVSSPILATDTIFCPAPSESCLPG